MATVISGRRAPGIRGAARLWTWYAVSNGSGQAVDADLPFLAQLAAAARAAGIQLHAVGFGQDADLSFLARLAPEQGALHSADDAAALLVLYQRLAQALPCQDSRGWSGR